MDVAALQKQFRGEILTPGSAEYEGSRKIWNAMIDRRPAAIARCAGPADVRAAVAFAVDRDIYPAIRGGGHNVAGLAMVDDGLVVDVTRMKGIYVDPAGRTATARPHVGRVRPRDAAIRARNNGRADLDHGHRRTDSRRRRWMADGPVRSGL